jgi:hypothetical protein
MIVKLFNTVDSTQDMCSEVTPFAVVAFAECVQQQVEVSSHPVNSCPRSPYLFWAFKHTFLWAEIFLDVSCYVNFLTVLTTHPTPKSSVPVVAVF